MERYALKRRLLLAFDLNPTFKTDCLIEFSFSVLYLFSRRDRKEASEDQQGIKKDPEVPDMKAKEAEANQH